MAAGHKSAAGGDRADRESGMARTGVLGQAEASGGGGTLGVEAAEVREPRVAVGGGGVEPSGG